MWSLEQDLEDVTPDDDDVRNQQIITDPNKFFMREMVRRAAQLCGEASKSTARCTTGGGWRTTGYPTGLRSTPRW